MKPKITIQHPSINAGQEVTVFAENVSGNLRPEVSNQIDVNADPITEKQTLPPDNPRFNLNNVMIVDGDNNLTWKHVVELTKIKFDGTNPIIVSINYGEGHNRYLHLMMSETEIPCLLSDVGFNLRSGLKIREGSSDTRRLLTFNMQFTETNYEA